VPPLHTAESQWRDRQSTRDGRGSHGNRHPPGFDSRKRSQHACCGGPPAAAGTVLARQCNGPEARRNVALQQQNWCGHLASRCRRDLPMAPGGVVWDPPLGNPCVWFVNYALLPVPRPTMGAMCADQRRHPPYGRDAAPAGAAPCTTSPSCVVARTPTPPGGAACARNVDPSPLWRAAGGACTGRVSSTSRESCYRWVCLRRHVAHRECCTPASPARLNTSPQRRGTDTHHAPPSSDVHAVAPEHTRTGHAALSSCSLLTARRCLTARPARTIAPACSHQSRSTGSRQGIAAGVSNDTAPTRWTRSICLSPRSCSIAPPARHRDQRIALSRRCSRACGYAMIVLNAPRSRLSLPHMIRRLSPADTACLEPKTAHANSHRLMRT